MFTAGVRHILDRRGHPDPGHTIKGRILEESRTAYTLSPEVTAIGDEFDLNRATMRNCESCAHHQETKTQVRQASREQPGVVGLINRRPIGSRLRKLVPKLILRDRVSRYWTVLCLYAFISTRLSFLPCTVNAS